MKSPDTGMTVVCFSQREESMKVRCKAKESVR